MDSPIRQNYYRNNVIKHAFLLIPNGTLHSSIMQRYTQYSIAHAVFSQSLFPLPRNYG